MKTLPRRCETCSRKPEICVVFPAEGSGTRGLLCMDTEVFFCKGCHAAWETFRNGQTLKYETFSTWSAPRRNAETYDDKLAITVSEMRESGELPPSRPPPLLLKFLWWALEPKSVD